MGALGRTARRLKAGLAAFLLLTFAAALAPQDAQAQSVTITLTATPGPGQVTLTWTTSNPPAGIVVSRLAYRPLGGSYQYLEAPVINDASSGSYTLMGLTPGTTYQFFFTNSWANHGQETSNILTATPTAAVATGKTITLSAPSTSITEGDSGFTDVTVTATLGEGAPAEDPDTGIFRVSLVPASPAGTATGSNKGSDGCTPPLNPVDTDWCFLAGTLTFAEGETQATKKVRILGDTRDEPNETIKLVSAAQKPGWTSGSITLTITDDDDPPAKPAGFSATKGDTSVYLAWTNPGDASIIRWEYQQKAGNGNYGSWTQITSSGATTVRHRITSLTNGTVYKFKIRAVNGNGNGAASDEVTVTPNPPVAPVLTAATSTTNRQVALTWTHAGSTASDYIDGGTAVVYWQTGHRLKGTTTWQGVSANVSQVTGNTRRTLTTRGLEDNYPNGALVEVAVRAVGSSILGGTETKGPWSNARTVTYMNTDTDALTITGAPVSVTAGSTSSYTVALTKAYAGTLSITSSATAKATVDPATLTFTTSNYNTAKTVTVTGVEAGTATINHAFRLTGATTDVIPDAGTVAVTVSAATTSAGVTISPTSLTVEEGSSNNYTVKLDKAPSANVTITVSGASGDVTVADSPLTFTPGNFSAEQTITVRAAHDGDTTDDTATLTHTASSTDTDYGASLEIDDVDVTVTDTTPTFQLLTDPATVTEGTAISLTVTSDKSISGNWPVRLTLAARSSSGFDAADIPGTLGPREFNANFGAATKTGTVTIPTSTDSATEGAEAYRITLSERTTNVTYAVGDDATADGALNDAPVPVPAAPTGLSASAGNGQVALSWTKPTGSITGYKVRYGKTGARGSATWTAIAGSDANTESHTVMSLDNDADYSFKVRAVNASGDGVATDWVTATPVAPASVSLSIADATAAESAGTMSFTVTATPAPTSPVTFKYTVTAESGDTATAGTDFVAVTTATAASIAANASTATITVSLVDDNVLGSDKTFTVTLSEPSSGVTISDAMATGTISDDDEASVTVSTAALTVAEGGSNTYTVKLDTEPTANVTVTVAGASGDVTVTGSSLTFTTANYNTAQTVTVNAAEDTDTAADPDVTLTHSAAGGGYGSVSIASVVVSVTENDTPPAPSGLSATAGNGQVVLAWSNPNNASITGYQVRSGKTGDRDSATWAAIANSGAGTLSHTVTGLDNEAEYSFQLRAQNAVGEGAATGWVTATPVTPTVAGVTISTAALTVEEGASNTYTVKLDTAPSANVTITVGGASGEVTVVGSPLTFTPGNFGTAQTITVNAGADEDATDDTATLTHTASSSDTDYGASLEIDDVDVTVTDTTPTLQLSTDPAAVTEGTAISLTVTSDQALTGDLTVSLTLAARDSSGFTAEDIAGALGPRNFTAAFGNPASATGTVTIPTSADSAVEGAEAYRITLNDAAGYALGDDVTADGALNDGAVSAPAAPSGLTASAGNEQVALSWSDPDDDSITRYEVRYGKTGERSGAPWNAIPGSGANTGSHTVTGLDNDAEYSFQLRAVNPSGEGSATDWVTATPVSSSTVALTIADVTALESGTFMFTVSADAAPASDVTFQYTVVARSGDTATAGADFTAVTTATAQTLAAGATRTTITVAVTDDDLDEGDETFTVILSEPSANATLANTTATGTISDDDESPVLAAMADRTLAAGQAVELTASATDGDGDSVSYAWTRKVGENTPALPEGTALNQARLRFTIPATATGRYTMTVTASDGHGNTDSEEVVITIGDPTRPSGEPPVETPVETPTPVAGVTLSASALTVEEGGSGNYTVVLDTQPTEEVTVTIGGVAGDVTATPASLTFSRSNYSTAQTVTVTAAEDDDAVTDTAVTLTHSASGGGYGSVRIDAVTVTISEDDEAGVTLSSSALTIEEGGSGNYTVVLDSQPVGGEVTVTPTNADSSALTVMPSALRFTAANWNTAQTVTVTAVEDDDTDDERVRVSHAVSGGDYGGVVADSVTVTVTDTPAAGQVGRANRVNARVLPQVAVAVLSQTQTAVAERIDAVASGQPAPASLQFGALPGRTLADERDFRPRSEPSTPTVSEMLDGATFALPLQRSGDRAAIQPSHPALWGRGERVELSGTEEAVSWDGDLWSAHLGADRYIRPDLLAGAALSYGQGEVDTQTTDQDGNRIAGTYETTLTSIHPYVSQVWADGSHLWGSLGYGQGEVRIREGSATRKTDLSQWSLALGGRRVLLEEAGRIAGGITRVALKGEGALSQLDTDADAGLTELTVQVTRLRLLLEGSHERALADGATVTPALEAGLRHDGGDVGSGLGLEAGASLTWRDSQAGWLARLRARTLVAHEKDRDEWGISALVGVEPAADGRGLSLSFGPEYGHTASGMEGLFDYSLSPVSTDSATREDMESRLEAELGYGIGVSRTGAMALLTPYAGFSRAQSGAETFRVGARYRLGQGLSVGIEGKHQSQAVGERSLMLRAAIRW